MPKLAQLGQMLLLTFGLFCLCYGTIFRSLFKGTLFQSPISPYFTNPMAPNPPKRRTGGRRPKEEEQKLPPEEEEKRRQRRLRNKEAAARCRKRRLDQMTTFEIVREFG